MGGLPTGAPQFLEGMHTQKSFSHMLHFSLWQPCTLVFLLPHAPQYTDWPHIPGRGRDPTREPGAKQLSEQCGTPGYEGAAREPTWLYLP